METDSFYYQLFKKLPRTFFELLSLPAERVGAYRFASVEVKKSFRIDGLFIPQKRGLPIYFLEVQNQPMPAFYANLLAKVFWYLQENDPGQDWAAVALFGSRKFEPTLLGPYQELLASKRIIRVYLDEYPMPEDPPLGLGILQLVTASEAEVAGLAGTLVAMAESSLTDSETGRKVIELAEEVLMRKLKHLDRGVRKMMQLHDIRESKAWQEWFEEGKAEANKKWVRACLAKGMSIKQIADLVGIPAKEVRRLAKDAAK
jgi:predicted transposase/invertase (TIGR01784 family)